MAESPRMMRDSIHTVRSSGRISRRDPTLTTGSVPRGARLFQTVFSQHWRSSAASPMVSNADGTDDLTFDMTKLPVEVLNSEQVLLSRASVTNELSRRNCHADSYRVACLRLEMQLAESRRMTNVSLDVQFCHAINSSPVTVFADHGLQCVRRALRQTRSPFF